MDLDDEQGLRDRRDWYHLAELLERQGRVPEAIDLLRPLVADECCLSQLLGLLSQHGRAGEGLTVIDELAAGLTAMPQDWMWHRLRLLADAGRLDEAVSDLLARPESRTDSFLRCVTADLLADAGRLDEAVELLWPYRDEDAGTLVPLLIRQGRTAEATIVGRDRAAPWTQPAADRLNPGEAPF